MPGCACDRKGPRRLIWIPFWPACWGESIKIEAPVEDTQVVAGQPLFSGRTRGRRLVIPAPVTGTVRTVHAELEAERDELSDLPYDAWICEVEPEEVVSRPGVFRVGPATREWLAGEVDRFRELILGQGASAPAFSLPDGGACDEECCGRWMRGCGGTLSGDSIGGRLARVVRDG